MLAPRIHDPEQILKPSILFSGSIERQRADGGNHGVCAGALKHGCDSGGGLVVGQDYGGEVVEGAGEEGGEEFDRVGEVDGDAGAGVGEDVAADDVYLF